jgi:uncharacterized protein (TIRG00374 family)
VADELAPAQARLNLKDIIRYVVGAGAGIAVLLLLFGRRGDLAAAWHRMIGAKPGWVAAAIAAEALSLWAFAYLQHRVLRLAGTAIGVGGLFLLSLANDAIALSVPGEPAVSSAYRYRYYRRRGVTGAGAGWTIFTILIAQAIGMSLVLLLGVVVALTGGKSAGNAGAAAVGLVIVIVSFAILIRRDLVLRLAAALVRAARRAAGYLRRAESPPGGIGARMDSTLARMREIPLSPASTVGVVALATAAWACDFLCLLCSFGATGAVIPWNGVLLAYGVAQVVGSFPIIPGGIGVVEGSLAVILAAYGASQVQALSVALVFRVVSFWLAIVVGWISFGAIALLRPSE